MRNEELYNLFSLKLEESRFYQETYVRLELDELGTDPPFFRAWKRFFEVFPELAKVTSIEEKDRLYNALRAEMGGEDFIRSLGKTSKKKRGFNFKIKGERHKGNRAVEQKNGKWRVFVVRNERYLETPLKPTTLYKYDRDYEDLQEVFLNFLFVQANKGEGSAIRKKDL